MAGDKFNIRVSSWYKTGGVSPGTPVNALTDLALNLLNGVLAIPNTAQHGITQTNLQSTGVLSSNVNSFLTDPSKINPVGGRPKAYLNWILFDEQFKYVASSSGADQVPAESVYGTAPNQIVYPHIKSNLPIDKNGYLYVYVSDETPNIDVFFDNLQVTHIHGPLVEETSYYPFGLVQAGISSKAFKGPGYPTNKKLFTSQTLDDDLGWNTYQMKWRTMDPQIGRFLQIDPLAPQYVHNSTYAYAENDVIRAIDLEGLEKFIVTNRSFHPDATFGGGYSGDARNFTTQENKYTTSRIEQKINIDFTAKTYSANVRSDESHYPALGLTDKATPTQDFKQAEFTKNPNGTTSFDLQTSYAGDNPLFPGKVDMIDVKTNMSLTITGKDNQFLSVGANMKGDNFPAAESYIRDANGNAVFIGVAPIPKGGNVTDIIGNNNRPMFTTGFTIELNKSGNFSGKVIYDGVKYPIPQWNKFSEETPTKR